MVHSAVTFASAICVVGLHLCHCLKQYPYAQGAYGQAPYPPQAAYPPQAQPMYAPPPYGSFPYAPYNQPGAYAQSYVPAFPPSYAAPPSAVVAAPPSAAVAAPPTSGVAAQPATPFSEPVVAGESFPKHGERPIQAYLSSLLPGAKKNASVAKDTSVTSMPSMPSIPSVPFAAKNTSVALKDTPAHEPLKEVMKQLDVARQFFTASAQFIGNTAKWVNDTKHSNDTAQRFADLLQHIPHRTGKLVEKLAIPVLGNVALDKLGLTARERMLANVGLASALATTIGRGDDEPLLGHGNHTAAPEAEPAVALARQTAEGEVPTVPPTVVPTAHSKQSYWERTIRRWAHRGK